MALRKRSRPVNKSDDEDAEEEEEDDEETAELDESAEKENGGDTSKEDVVGEEDEDMEKVKDEVAENGKKKATLKKDIAENGAEVAGAKEGDAVEGGEKLVEGTSGEAEGAVASAEIEGRAKKEKTGTEFSTPKKAAKEGKTVSPIRYKSTFIKLACPHCPKAITKTFKVGMRVFRSTQQVRFIPRLFNSHYRTTHAICTPRHIA